MHSPRESITNQVEIKKKMSKEYPSLTEEEYAGFMANIRRLDARDEKRKQKKAALATGDEKRKKSATATGDAVRAKKLLKAR